MNIRRMKARLSGTLDMSLPAHQAFFKRIEELAAPDSQPQRWSRYRNFWPPALLNALRENSLVAFMGAGVSIASKLPSWRDLLETRLGVPAEFLADDYLKSESLSGKSFKDYIAF